MMGMMMGMMGMMMAQVRMTTIHSALVRAYFVTLVNAGCVCI
jgi:hypothetical protein